MWWTCTFIPCGTSSTRASRARASRRCVAWATRSKRNRATKEQQHAQEHLSLVASSSEDEPPHTRARIRPLSGASHAPHALVLWDVRHGPGAVRRGPLLRNPVLPPDSHLNSCPSPFPYTFVPLAHAFARPS